ncbi:MAG: hypothetical protein J6F30_08865 [Cellulosilyticum sp.]|nr:hypothetical protein [Cellulosilyticum sp.]
MAKKETTANASNYSASIVEASRELTAKERVMFKDLGNAESMVDFATSAREQGGKATIDVADWAVINVHNEATDDVDYTNYLIIDKNGNKYYTGSESLWNSFKNIYEEMKNETEDWGIQLNLLPSKNYKGKEILTCSLI